MLRVDCVERVSAADETTASRAHRRDGRRELGLRGDGRSGSGLRQNAGGDAMKAFATAILVSMLSGPLTAQWLKHPTPDIPRTADGKPNLNAPAPRTPDGTPDLSGLWQRI